MYRTSFHARKNRCAANSLLARAGVAPSRTCVRRGGALQVLGDAPGVRVIERPGLVAALVSSAVTEARFVAAYAAALATESENSDSEASLQTVPVPDSNASRRRVCALKKALGDLHAEDGAFAVVAFDVAAGRVLAARTANAAPLHYGFTQDGALVASGGLTATRLFPDAGDAALRLTPLPSGRFVFGHRFVKPIEFTRFWDTAASNRAAAPARDACPDAARAAAGADAAAEGARRRWAATGSVGDGESRWNATARGPALKVASEGAYVPPALRKAREAAAAAAAAVERDAQVAKALAAQEAVVSSLGDALAAAVAARAPAVRSSLRRAGLRSSTFTLGRVPGAGAETKKLGLSGLGKLRTSSFRVEPAALSASAAPRTCAETEAGFASFKANFERLAATRGSTAA